MKIFIKSAANLLLSFFAISTFSITNAYAQTERCELRYIACVDPVPTEYVYVARDGVQGRFSTLEELYDAVTYRRKVRGTADCFNEVVPNNSNFIDYFEVGNGEIRYPPPVGGLQYRWKLGLNTDHRIQDGYRNQYVGSTCSQRLLNSVSYFPITKTRFVNCPEDSQQNGAVCEKFIEKPDDNKNPMCVTGPNLPVSGSPCDFRTGAKYRNETDFSYGNLIFTRNYHSLSLDDVGFGKGWHNQYFKRLVKLGNYITIFGFDGRSEIWLRSNGIWTGDADSNYLITESVSGYTVTLKQGDVHEYDLSGRLLSETDTQGKVKTYEYDAENRLIKVSNHYQQFITFTYSTDGKNHIIKVTDAQGVEYSYEYDTNDNLTAVVYPDGDSDPANNPKRIYHYEDTNFPNHITGITNANGERYATFAYDATGKAIESALAPTTNSVGQQRVQLHYQGAN